MWNTVQRQNNIYTIQSKEVKVIRSQESCERLKPNILQI